MTAFEYDAFISHAFEDKEEVVRPLVAALQKYGLTIWFDELTLRIGDSLRASIEAGLAQSRFGVVIFSHAFFSKSWPPAELNALFARERQGQKVILPVWHGLTCEDMLRHAPIQADKLAVSTSVGVPAVAKKLVQVIRPEAFRIDTSREDVSRAGSRLIEQLEERYPGFGFHVVAGPPRQDQPQTGSVGSVVSGSQKIDISVKDPSVLPGSFSCKFVRTGITKFEEWLRTGRAQKFLADEFEDFESSLPLWEDAAPPGAGAELHFGPQLPPSTHTMTARVVLGGPPDEVIFPVVDFKPSRLGQQEAAIVGTRPGLPFTIHFTLPLYPGPSPSLRFGTALVGRDFRTIQHFSRGLAALRKCGRIRVVNLETEQVVFQGEQVTFGASQFDQDAFNAFVNEVVSVEQYFQVALPWPSRFTEDDFTVIEILGCLKDSRPLEATVTLSATVIKRKSEDENAQILQSLDVGVISICAEPREPSRYIVFGTLALAAPVRIVIEQAEILDAGAVKSEFLSSPPGGEIPIQLRSLSPVVLQLAGGHPPRDSTGSQSG
jgi:hypothetical protein